MKAFPVKLKTKLIVFLTVLLVLLGGALCHASQESTELILLSTTDLHGYVFSINYFNGKDLKGSLSRAATLIERERQLHDNVMLFDVGDTIQGSQLAYYWGVVNPGNRRGLEHVMAKAMNYLGYDAMVLGNHEFQIGKETLLSFVKDADFPVLSANTVFTGTDDLVFEPYTLIEKELKGGDRVTVGVLGLTTPRWVQWYGGMVGYEFDATDMYEAAAKYIPEMKSKGAEIVVVLMHSGLSEEETKEVTAGQDLLPEHDVLRVAKTIPGIDVIFYGHTHKVNTEKVINELTNKEVLLVQGKYHGRGIGKAVLTLVKDNDGTWQVVSKEGEVGLFTDDTAQSVEPHQELMAQVQSYHDEAMAYMETVIGKTAVELNSKTSRYADTALFQLIAKAQRWGVEVLYKDVAADALKNPVLSMVAPFLTGANGEDDYTMIEPGELALKDAGAIYLYDDLLQAIEIDGKTLKAYLERSAENFLQVTPNPGTLPILNSDFHGYYFDMIEGIKYQIDITQPVGSRIKNLTFQDRKIADDEKFTLLVPNFRAGGGGAFPGTGPEAKVVFNLTEGIETRDVLIEYIKEFGTIDLQPTHDWSLVWNFLDHWSAEYVYPLFRDGYILGEEQTGRLLLNNPVSEKEYLTALNKIFASNLVASPGTITRERAVKFLADLLRTTDGHTEGEEDNLGYLISLNIISGYPDGTYRLENELTRGEMAAIIFKCLKHLNTY